MVSKNCYGFIVMGLAIRLLGNLNAKTTGKFASNHIEMLLKELEKASFTVSLMGAVKLKDINKNCIDIDAAPIGEDLYQKLTNEMPILERVVYSEAMTKNIYVVPERRFNLEYLLKNQSKLLKDGSFNKLSDLAKYDFTSSCRCIAFGESTAAAFHILRATEDVLKNYYFKHKKTKRLKIPMWGPMTRELREKRTPPSSIILDSLDLVRNSYRNPTQHPEAIYDINSAQDLFGLCIDLINKMASEL